MSATISAGSGISHNGLTLNGVLSSIPAGGSARFRYGTVNGGSYSLTVSATPYANGNVSATLTGLNPSTTYYYILEILDSGGSVVSASNQGSATTLIQPTAVLSPATNVGYDTLTLNGTLYNIPAGGSARFRYGTVSGTYTLTAPASPYANGLTSAVITGLNPSTTYYYILEILDSAGDVVAVSTQGNRMTLAQPVVSCSAATGASADGLIFHGSLTNIPVGGSARFRYGTVDGGPYSLTVSATPYANGNVSAFVSGLISGTNYYYVLDVLDSGGNIIATSSQCGGMTSGAAPDPAAGKEALLVKLCSITGVIPMKDCATGEVILFVHVSSSSGDLIPTTSTEFPASAGSGVFETIGYFRSYYADKDGNYLSPQPTSVCSDPVTAIDYEILCDFGATPTERVFALWDSGTTPPTLRYYTAAADGSLTAYTAIGPIGSCSAADIEDTSNCYQAMAAGAGYSIGDNLYQILWWDTSSVPPTLIATVWRNQTTDAILAAAPAPADISPCANASPTILPVCFRVNASPFAIHAAYKVVTPSSMGVTTNFYWESDTGITHQAADVTEVECISESDPLVLCDDNGQFIMHIRYGSWGNVQAPTVTDMFGMPYAPAGAIRDCSQSVPTQVTSTIERLIDIGTITIPAGRRSVTVTVNVGDPTVQIGADPAVALVRNLSLSWSGSETDQTLLDSFVFTGVAGSDFYVTTTF